MNKARRKRCKHCNELFTPKYSTTQIVCSTKCAYAYSKKKNDQEKEENKKLIEQGIKTKKSRNKITTLIKSVVDTCHLYIRLRDENKPCISCGTPYKKDFQAGHFYKAELFSTIKFNEFNINGQCIKCNGRKEGNESQYRVNLPDRIGTENFEELNRLASLEKKTDFKWYREGLVKIRNYYKQKIKELKKASNV